MTNRDRLSSLAICALLVGPLSGATAEWSCDVAPYLWVPSASVDSSLPDLPPTTPPEVSRFATKLTGAFMGVGQVNHGSFGLFVDYDWLRLNTESTHPGPAYSAVDLDTSLVHMTAALTWRLPTNGSWQVELLAGARYWNVSGEQVFHSGLLPGFTRNSGQSWADAIIGLDLRFVIDDHWYVTGKSLLGALSSGSNSMLEALVGVGYNFSGGNSALFGWRYLQDDFARRAFTWNLKARGFLVGYNFHF